MKPIYLLADSQLLFRAGAGAPLLWSIRELLPAAPAACYVGASNGDDPQYYAIFEAASRAAGIHDCRMILSSFTAEDEAFVREADLILLAGGEVGRGWRVFCEVGLRELIIERYYEGAVLLGVSAGAVQLGLCGPVEVDGQVVSVTETFGLVPFVIGAHEEARGWRALRETVRLARRRAEGFGIPAGGGAIYYPDGRVEPVGRPLFELSPGEDAGCV